MLMIQSVWLDHHSVCFIAPIRVDSRAHDDTAVGRDIAYIEKGPAGQIKVEDIDENITKIAHAMSCIPNERRCARWSRDLTHDDRSVCRDRCRITSKISIG